MKILFSLVLLFISTNLLFSQSNIPVQNTQEYEDVQSVPQETVSQSTQSDNIIIKNVNQTYYSKTVAPDGYTRAVLTGSVHIVYAKKDIFADEVVIKLLGGKVKVLIAKGNALLKSKDRTTIAREIFVYPESKNIQFLDPVTLQNNIYVRGLGLRFNDDDLTRLEDISMTTSTRYIPRYTLNAGDGWIEQDNDFILVNAYLQIGQDPLIYFPVFYNNHYGTGMITNLTYDAYLGFMIFNTFSQKSQVHSEKFMFDYYQKLGFYVGNDFFKTDIGNLQTHIGLAYDYHTKLSNGVVENLFEQILGQGPSIGRSLRYNFSVDYDKQLFQSTDPEGLTVRYKGLFKELSDPDFVNQFESKRYDKFDLKTLFFSDNEGYNRTQSAGSSSGGEGRRIDNSLTLGFYGYSLQISSSMIYNLNPKSQSGKNINTFSPSYWKNTLSQTTLPQIDFNKSFLIYTVEQDFPDESKINIPVKLDVNYTFGNINNYEADGLSNKNINNRLRTVFSSNITYDTSGLFKLYFPLSLENNLYNTYTQTYASTTANNPLESATNTFTNTVTANYSPELTFRALENFTITNTGILKTTYGKNARNTDDRDATQAQNDRNATYNDLSQNLGDTLRLEWVDEESEYLSGYVEGNYTYTLANRSGAILPISSRQHSKTHATVLTANMFKTTLGVKTSNQYGNKISPENSLLPLDVTLSSTAIPFVTISDTYSWDRFDEKQKSNRFNLTTSIPSRLNIASWFWFSSVDITIDWSSDFGNPMLDYLNYKFSLLFNITKYWQIEFFVQGNNQRLYMYGDFAPMGQRRNFFTDLFQSFAFWSNQLRQESNFKMQTLGLTITHDLDEWVFKASASLEPKVTNGKSYFDTQFYIEVILKDLGMLSAPRMSQGTDDVVTTTV